MFSPFPSNVTVRESCVAVLQIKCLKMSYWNQNSVSSSQLDDLLSKDDVSLQEVIEEAELIQECKSQNKKLIDL